MPEGARVPKPLEGQVIDGGELVWLPFAQLEAGRAALAMLEPSLLLFPPRDADVDAVVATWLRLYDEAPAGVNEAVLQVVDDQAALAQYLDAEEALWEVIYRVHPHKESAGIYPRALAEARWLCAAVLDHPDHDAKAEFLTLAAFEAVARELLVSVRRGELLALRDHLRGIEPYLGW